MPSVGFEPTIWAGEGPQIYALDRAATGTGSDSSIYIVNKDGLMLNHKQTKGETEIQIMFYLSWNKVQT